MPIYEYACDSCGHKFERRQRFSDEPIAECPTCGAHVHRVLYPAGIIFKGSGWYINDSRKSNDSNGASSTSTTSTSSASDSASKADTKKETSSAATES